MTFRLNNFLISYFWNYLHLVDSTLGLHHQEYLAEQSSLRYCDDQLPK